MKQMKRLIIIIVLIAGMLNISYAQNRGNKVIKKETRELTGFTGIKVGSAFDVELSKGDFEVIIESDENLMDNIITEVENNTLVIRTKNLKKANELNAYVTLPELDHVNAHGASDVIARDLFTTDKFFNIAVSGASDVDLNLEVDEIKTKASGASDLTLTGKANKHYLYVSGASGVSAGNFITKETEVKASGASSAKVHATENLSKDVSGASSVSSNNSPVVVSAKSKGDPAVVTIVGPGTVSVITDENGDTTRVNFGALNVEVIEDDSVKVTVGSRRVVVDEDGNVEFQRVTKMKFNGHWGGFDLGINGYLTPDFDMNFKPEHSYLDLRMEKSVNVGINFFEQNIALSKNQKWGMLSGIGVEWRNYRFKNNALLVHDSTNITGYFTNGANVSKYKLVNLYVNVPVMFEFQTNRYHRKNSFHIGMGAIFGMRILTWTKTVHESHNVPYNILDPATGEIVGTATTPSGRKNKIYDNFHMHPFKVDAGVRIGWGIINLYATYSLTTLFKSGNNPELYPFSAGITLVNW